MQHMPEGTQMLLHKSCCIKPERNSCIGKNYLFTVSFINIYYMTLWEQHQLYSSDDHVF